MDRPSRPDVLDLQSHQSSTSTRARSRSNGSVDKPLNSNGSSIYSLANPQLSCVSPEPAYIAASAATGIVTGNHEDFLQDESSAGHPTPTIPVTPASLKLINQFLDFLLYSFLSSAKSTTLKALRPAISEVLRSRLAKEAVAGADQELSSYLGGGDDGDVGDIGFDDVNELQGSNTDWDLDSTWKRTRLLCMVYSSLGDIEEDDEEVYSGYGNLEGIVGSQQYEKNSVVPGIVSPAVAIWLTSVLEFMGEQTLLLAGHAAINRFTQRMTAAGYEDHVCDAKCAVERERPMVEELDTEKVALNSSLGRLWRQWRKRVRGRGSSFSVPSHHGTLLQRTASRKSSSSTLTSALAEPKHPQPDLPESRGMPQRTAVEETELNFAETGCGQSEEICDRGLLTPIVETATLTGDGEFRATPSMSGADGSLVPGRAECDQKRRPQSLALMPWTTTEAPFFFSRHALKRSRSWPDITRSDFPDPSVEGVADAEDQMIQSVDTDPEEEPELAMVTEPVSEKSGFLERRSSTQEQTLGEARAITPDGKVAEPVLVSPSPCDGGHTGAIGLACTSDILIPPPASRPSSKQGVSQESHVVPRTADQQRYERFPLSSRRPSELAETRRASTFQEQRAADRRPSATTLNEFLDHAIASDDDSSIANSQRDFRGGRLTPGGTNYIPSDYFTHSKQASSASSKYSQHSQLSDRKLGKLTLIQPPCSTTSLPISGSNMRAWTPPQTPNKTRRSLSFGMIPRPVTAHSGTSQSSTKLKSFIAWPMENGKTKVPEPDDDSRSSLHSERPSMKLAGSGDKERSFEELISSGDTIHCTITPDPLRRMEVKEVPRTATSALADFLRNTGPDNKETRVAPPSRSSNLSRPSTARAIPIIPKDSSVEDVTSLSHLLRSTSISPVEIRPQTPNSSIPSPHLSVSGQSHKHNYCGSGTVSPMASSFGSTPISPGGITGIPAVLRQNRSHSNSSGSRLVARDASGFTTSDSTSALADFFRNTTPPIDAEGQATQRRISRSVAPFRNTMDSDQFELPEGPELVCEQVENNEIPASDLAFLSSAVAPPDSYQSSFSSSTPLLPSNSKKQHEYGVANSVSEPKRKQYRVKDPYAIDIDELDDDEDMEALSLILPKKREEESLMDFLRNVPPPPQHPTSPPEPEATKTVQKKNSSVSLISRFGRGGRKSSIASNVDKFPLPPVSQVHGGYKTQEYMQGAEQKRPPFKVDMDSTSTTSSVRFGNRPTPRGMQTDRDNTDGLADFLKFSDPPLAVRAPAAKEDNSAISKFRNFSFSRKSKRTELPGLV